jgi:hypothetical protein
MDNQSSPRRSWFWWITTIGFWWSMLTLLHSLRTTELLFAKLEEWAGVLAWLFESLYAAWGAIRSAFLTITRPLYGFLPWDIADVVRDGVSMGFFVGLRVIPFLLSSKDPRVNFWRFATDVVRGIALALSLIALMMFDRGMTESGFFAGLGFGLSIGAVLNLTLEFFGEVRRRAQNFAEWTRLR